MATILGVTTGELDNQQIQAKITNFLATSVCHQIVTPNPEIILKSQNDEELFYILNRADLSLADGFGLKLVAGLSRQKLFRQTGADLLPSLLQEANNNKYKVLIINRTNGLSTKVEIENYLQKKYRNIDFLVLDLEAKVAATKDEFITINLFKADLVICLFGAPYQEKYIYNLIRHDCEFKLGVGLGGAFDFLTGKIMRAPQVMRDLGLEWLWRLIQQPRRLARIYRATVVFFCKSLIWLYILPRLYRNNVAVLVYHNTPQGREILIVERQDEKNHWQLIQGGVDGLSLKQAGLKEMQEELNISHYTIKGVYKNLYQYSFNQSNGKHKSRNHNFGYKGQKQSLLIVEFTGRKAEIKINYWDHQNWKFVEEKKFINTLHRCRQEAAKIYLQKLIELHN